MDGKAEVACKTAPGSIDGVGKYVSETSSVDEIRNGSPTDEWTTEMLNKLCDIWDRWHLNDMRPY